MTDQVGGESRDEEEELHAERVRCEEEPIEDDAAVGILQRDDHRRRGETPRGLKHDAQQQGEGTGGVESM